MARPLPWSHSTLSGFSTCARQYEEIKVLRNFQDQKNAASLWGDTFHKMAEKYIRSEGTFSLPPEMLPYKDYLDQFDRPGVTLVEQQYALSRLLHPCAFTGEDVWMRGIIDVLTLERSFAYVDDHKTGANRKKDMQQLIIFALLTFYHHPEIHTCQCTYHWLQLKARDSETFHRSQINDLWATLIPKLQAYKHAFDSGVFPARPSGLCKKHCAVNTCEYFGRGLRG